MTAIYWLFYTVSFAYFIIIVYPLPLIVMARFIPEKMSILNILKSLLNIVVLAGELYLLYLIFDETDFMYMLKEMLVNYMHGAF